LNFGLLDRQFGVEFGRLGFSNFHTAESSYCGRPQKNAGIRIMSGLSFPA
jgi:hypothetical protein